MTPGIHKMPMEQYLADPCAAPSLSASLADTLLRQSPLHAKWQHPRLSPNYRQDHEEKFDIGTTAHSLVLEKDSSRICVINPEEYPGQKGGIPDGWTNKAIREARDLARSNGLTPILSKHYAAVRAMVEVARDFMASCEIAKHLADADAELVCVAKDGDTWLRARPDLMSKDRKVLVNYKTTENAAPGTFCRQITRMGYDLNAVFYERVMKNLGRQSEQFFIAQEVTPPHACSLVGLDPASRDIAEGKLDLALAIWGKCISSGRWGSYPKNVFYTTPTTWEMSEHEERRLTFDEIIEMTGNL